MGSHKVALLGNKRIKVLSVFFLQSVYYNSYSNKEPLNSANVAPINSHAECQQYTIVSCSLERAVVLEKLQKNAPTPYGQQIWPSRGGLAQGLLGQNNTMSSKGCWGMWPSCCITTSSPWGGIHLVSLFRNAPSTLFSLTVKPDGPDQLYTTGPTGQNLHLCSA